jgi:hypothetical protein
MAYNASLRKDRRFLGLGTFDKKRPKLVKLKRSAKQTQK